MLHSPSTTIRFSSQGRRRSGGLSPSWQAEEDATPLGAAGAGWSGEVEQQDVGFEELQFMQGTLGFPAPLGRESSNKSGSFVTGPGPLGDS